MLLSDEQIRLYHERGFLFFPGLLTDVEVGALQSALPAILERQGPEVVHEQGGVGATRLVFGAHAYSESFRLLSRLPRLLLPCRQLLGEHIYLHQSRLNPKQGFGGGNSWDWHQDFPPWHEIDGMPEPRCVMATVFVDDCSAAKSPLLVVPGSHREGSLESKPHEDTRDKGYDLMHVGTSTMAKLAEENGITALIGPAGSVGFIDCNLLHGSANNVSPWRRAIMYLIYNAVSNACTGTDRDWHHNNRDFTALQPVEEDALARFQTE